jgi:hypothetical protein
MMPHQDHIEQAQEINKALGGTFRQLVMEMQQFTEH